MRLTGDLHNGINCSFMTSHHNSLEMLAQEEKTKQNNTKKTPSTKHESHLVADSCYDSEELAGIRSSTNLLQETLL